MQRLDGAIGDLGIAALNALRWDIQYPLEGSLLPLGPDTNPEDVKNLKDKTDHEVLDLFFSNLSASDQLGLNAEEICTDLDSVKRLQDMPGRAISRIGFVFIALRQIVDPPQEPLPMKIIVPEGQEPKSFLIGEGFRSIACLVNHYEINLNEAVGTNMGGLKERIPGEHKDKLVPKQ